VAVNVESMARDDFEIRSARPFDAPAIAVIHRNALRGALPHLPDLHTSEEDVAFFRDRVLTRCEVWVDTDGNGTVVGFCGVSEGWIEHFYVAPSHQGRGVGSRLLRHAMARQPSFRLWTFQRNARARRFYEKHGFIAVKETDGSGNEEREPDVLYAWARRLVPRFRSS
jgi:ribosomal protein S18 acetylase RimI-like enzyme